MRRSGVLLALLALLVVAAIAPAAAHHKPGHHHRKPTTTATVSTTATTAAPTTITTTPVTTTTIPTPTTTAPTTTTTTPPTQPGAGDVKFFTPKSALDPWTSNPTDAQKQFMRDHYHRMLVDSPYFDSRLTWYDRTVEYTDAYAIKPAWPQYAQHPEWILTDFDTGRQVFIDWGCSGGTCPQYAADISNPAYRQWFLDRIQAKVDLGYHGIYLDDTNLVFRFSNGTTSTSRILDPNTGQLLTLADWQRYFAEFTEAIRAEFPGIEIVHNTIWYVDQTAFGDPFVSREIAAADWVMIEHGGNDGGLDAGGAYGYRTLLAFIDRVHAQGTNVIVNDDVGSTMTEAEHNLATYLLVTEGNDMVSSEMWRIINPDNFWAGFQLDLGDALGARYDWGGFIRRDFDGGIVVTREPDIGSATFTVPAGYTRIDGTPAPATITLAPQTSVVLLAAG
jgi:Hypothetical glycosyl hydrolase family 15